MSEHSQDQFYRDQYQGLLMDKLDSMERKIDDQGAKLANVEKKVNYMYAWAAGVGAAASFLFFLVKEKFFKN